MKTILDRTKGSIMTSRWMGTAAIAATLVAGCGSQTETKPGDDTPGTYAITFPSTAAAVATDTVQVSVFDASNDAGTLCLTLLQQEKSGLDLSGAVVAGQPIATCDLLAAESTQSAATQIRLAYGSYAFVAVARRKGADFLRGCAIATVSENSETVTIPVAPSNLATTPVPALPSTCDPNTPLTKHCDPDPTVAAQCSP